MAGKPNSWEAVSPTLTCNWSGSLASRPEPVKLPVPILAPKGGSNSSSPSQSPNPNSKISTGKPGLASSFLFSSARTGGKGSNAKTW